MVLPCPVAHRMAEFALLIALLPAASALAGSWAGDAPSPQEHQVISTRDR
jgi:hypothetical protein